MAVENNDLSFVEIKRIGKLTSDGVFIYNISNKRFTYLNPAFINIVEINKKLLMEEPGIIAHSLPEADSEYLLSRYSEVLDKGRVEDVQIRLRQSNAEKILSCNAYLSSEYDHIVGFLSDITKPRQHEDYLVNFGARKDVLLDMVSQNLSTPLNLSKFTVDLIEKAVHEKKYNKLNAHIQLMREVTTECIRIIDKFLQEEHLESPKVDTKVNRFDVIEKVMVLLDKLKEANPDKNFTLKAEMKHLFINADMTKFFQIVHNVISNSIKFTQPNGHIEVTVRESKAMVQLIIIDDGIGIPDDIKPFIFEKKSRAARPGLKGEISNGIGLYVVKELTELLNGKVSFESKENKGTRFTVDLPKDAPF